MHKMERFMERHIRTCQLCDTRSKTLDYKDEKTLVKFTTERGKIIPRRISGLCAKHQRVLCRAVKRARFIAILPYIAEYNR